MYLFYSSDFVNLKPTITKNTSPSCLIMKNNDTLDKIELPNILR